MSIKLRRLAMIMEPEPGNPREELGTLNPAAARGPDGRLYLFPRLVAKGNFSRIGIVRVVFNPAGDPTGVERLGIALEPEAEYELRPGGGGCEDPRVTYVEPLGLYVMNYVAFSAGGPRVALAFSEDLLSWKRIGLANFAPFRGVDFQTIDDKDSCSFPIALSDPSGRPSLGLIHRPLFPGTRPEDTARNPRPHTRKIDPNRESIWISYCALPNAGGEEQGPTAALGIFRSPHRLARPVFPWEELKIGVGAPPVRCKHGWLVVYHGVGHSPEPLPPSPNPLGVQVTDPKAHLCYSAGLMILSENDPRKILYRSPEPVLTPEVPEERNGVIADVVFPTGIDRRDDIGQPNRFDIYYGMADDRVGVARLDLPDTLPE